jgi:hypothetical protein
MSLIGQTKLDEAATKAYKGAADLKSWRYAQHGFFLVRYHSRRLTAVGILFSTILCVSFVTRMAIDKFRTIVLGWSIVVDQENMTVIANMRVGELKRKIRKLSVFFRNEDRTTLVS